MFIKIFVVGIRNGGTYMAMAIHIMKFDFLIFIPIGKDKGNSLVQF